MWLHWCSGPGESVKQHNRNKATTHPYSYPILPSHRREVDPFSSLRPIERARAPSWEGRSRTTTRKKRPFGGHSCHANPARPQYNHLQVSSIILAPAHGAAAAPAHQTLGFGMTSESSALSNPPTLFPSTNPSTRPRTSVTTQAAALPHVLLRLAVQSTATSSTSIVGRLPMPSPTAPLSSARRRCPRRASPPSSEGGGLASQLAVDNPSTTRLSAVTPIPAHRAALRGEIDSIPPLRRSSLWSTAWLRALGWWPLFPLCLFSSPPTTR